MDDIPNELILYILKYSDIYTLKNISILNKRFYKLASIVSKQKELIFVDEFILNCLNIISKMYIDTYYTKPTHIDMIIKLFSKLEQFIYTNLYKEWFIKINPYMFSFFIFEWVGLKNQGFNCEEEDDMDYLVCKFRSNNDYSNKIRLFNRMYIILHTYDNTIIDEIITCF